MHVYLRLDTIKARVSSWKAHAEISIWAESAPAQRLAYVEDVGPFIIDGTQFTVSVSNIHPLQWLWQHIYKGRNKVQPGEPEPSEPSESSHNSADKKEHTVYSDSEYDSDSEEQQHSARAPSDKVTHHDWVAKNSKIRCSHIGCSLSRIPISNIIAS